MRSRTLKTVLFVVGVLGSHAPNAQTMAVVNIPPSPQFRIDSGANFCADTRGGAILGPILSTPFGDSCDSLAAIRQSTLYPPPILPAKSRLEVFVDLGNFTYRLQSQVNALIADNAKLREENAALNRDNLEWRKLVLDETLSRLDAMPQRFASQDSVIEVLIPRIAEALARDASFTNRVRKATP